MIYVLILLLTIISFVYFIFLIADIFNVDTSEYNLVFSKRVSPSTTPCSMFLIQGDNIVVLISESIVLKGVKFK